MSKSLEEQKDFIIDAVLELRQRVNALSYLIRKLDERELPEIKLTLKLFDNLLDFVYLMLWENIVINLYWIYDKNTQRGLIRYLTQIRADEVSEKKVVEQILRIESLKSEIEKVKKFRDKWIAHRDKEPFEKYDEFWKEDRNYAVETLFNTSLLKLNDLRKKRICKKCCKSLISCSTA